MPINSPVRCSKANGRFEHAIQIVAGQLRTLKHAFEDGVEKQLKVEHAMLSWLVARTSDMV